jgi:transcriptional regulator with XRE-family HTH domain
MAESSIGARLRTALEDKGWSYTRLIAEMRKVAGRQGKTLPTTASLIAMLSRWLNDHERPSRFYREILSGALGLDPAELESDNGHELAVTSVAAGSDDRLLDLEYRGIVDRGLLDDLDALTDVYRRMDRRLGAASLFEDLTRHLQRVTAFRHASMTGANRQRLASIAGDVATLMGWQSLDTGRTARAWKYFRRAADAAKEAENPALQAFAIAEAAYIPLLGGNHRAALPMLGQARDLVVPAGSPAFRAWLCGAEAEAHAVAGDAAACLRALDCAEAALDEVPHDETPRWVAHFDRSHLVRWQGQCLVQLAQPAAAQPVLQEAVRSVDLSFVRARASTLVDLAASFLQQGEIEEGCRVATQALTLARNTRSARCEQRIVVLRSQVQLGADTPAVRQLDEQLRLA